MEINFHIPESEWVKLPAHKIKQRVKKLNKDLEDKRKEKEKNRCPFLR